MKLIVGLGNIGGEYRFTRHNIGFWALDTYLSRRRKRATKNRHHALFTSFNVEGEERWFIKPQRYMNRSGTVLAPFAREISATPEETLVLHDEADMDPGRLQIRLGGGSGGHRGLESIFETWGERDFYRLRIGVGKDPERELTDYVLEEVPESFLRPLAEQAADALEQIFRLGPSKAMNQVNAYKAETPAETDEEA